MLGYVAKSSKRIFADEIEIMGFEEVGDYSRLDDGGWDPSPTALQSKEVREMHHEEPHWLSYRWRRRWR